MSSTITINSEQSRAISEALRDYELHHSSTGAVVQSQKVVDEEVNAERLRHQNPLTWDYEHRRVPVYRPVNTQLDQSQRRVYNNGIERAFITVMFTGVYLQAATSQVWRASFGKIWDIGYRKGGEL